MLLTRAAPSAAVSLAAAAARSPTAASSAGESCSTAASLAPRRYARVELECRRLSRRARVTWPPALRVVVPRRRRRRARASSTIIPVAADVDALGDAQLAGV